MSAFPDSGHSDHGKMGKLRVRFRPKADIHNHSAGGARWGTDPELAQDQAIPVNRDEGRPVEVVRALELWRADQSCKLVVAKKLLERLSGH